METAYVFLFYFANIKAFSQKYHPPHVVYICINLLCEDSLKIVLKYFKDRDLNIEAQRQYASVKIIRTWVASGHHHVQ